MFTEHCLETFAVMGIQEYAKWNSSESEQKKRMSKSNLIQALRIIAIWAISNPYHKCKEEYFVYVEKFNSNGNAKIINSDRNGNQ